jgi:phosphatidate cytidylyltransferase
MAMKFEGLGLRVLSGLALIGPVAAAVWYGQIPFLVLLVLAAIAMSGEWVRLLQSMEAKLTGSLLAGAVSALLILQFVDSHVTSLMALIALVLIVGLFCFLTKRRASIIAGGILYVGLPLWCAQWLRQVEDGLYIIVFIFLSVWGTDIFAMFAGKTIGGPKLAPKISPNKTWSGLLGGIVGAMFGGALSIMLYNFLNEVNVALWGGFLSAALIAIVAQGGDLFESSIKRLHDIKDSGRIIPGHGGILDRVDGMVSALVAVGLYILFALHQMGESPITLLWGM